MGGLRAMTQAKHMNPDATSAEQMESTTWWRGHTHRLGPVLILSVSLVFLFAALPLQFGSISRPGPGFWPLVVSSLTAVLAIIAAFFPRQGEEDFDRWGSQRATSLLIALIAFPFLFGILGFVIPSILLIVFMMRVLSQEPWRRSAIVAVITTSVAYGIFALLLDVRLQAFTFGL